MRTIAFGEEHGCFILVHSAETPDQREWDDGLGSYGAYLDRARSPRGLIVTAGGAPTPKQRRSVEEVARVRGVTPRTAVLTGSTFVRGVVAAFGFVHPSIRAFDLGDLDGALRFLDIPPAWADDMRKKVTSLRAELGLPPLR